ncbi:MAG: OmpA family protein [Desulfobacterium sp.]|nr:OmpA family protein [Desulfobacterium sp.]
MKQKKSTLAAVSKERARLWILAVDYGTRLERLNAKLAEEALARAKAAQALAIANAEKALAIARGEVGKTISQDMDKAPVSRMAPSAMPPSVMTPPRIHETDFSGGATGAKIGYEELRGAIKKAGLQDWVDVVGDGTCVRIENQLPILFASGKANLVNEYKVFLKKFARFLKPYDVRIHVDGYADTDPIHTARYPSNFELGATRAANIVHELVRNGLKPSVFKIGSTGEHRFYANKTSKRKLLERRAQVSVIFSG